ncbi:hypothetical protein [Fuerstiella marisgermanici]|uniref:Uncharacterized protein n=1 Tax=Fuerstiella marisgermanici TaxID=1891926 RepID=A0A1P8W9P5_9PLAN|nr:hypothetical protein [Fuerstiella marisgermanici]APZ90761.1 hypothetical protein Fuma_00345 [Fuerstiella marisgermanici]
MNIFNGFTIVSVVATLTIANTADAQLRYPNSAAPTYNNSHTSPYQPQYANPPAYNESPRYNSVPYSQQSSNNAPGYNPYHDPNDRRYDSRRLESTPADRYVPGSSYSGTNSNTYVAPYQPSNSTIPYRSGSSSYNDPYRSNYGPTTNRNDERIYNSSYDRDTRTDEFHPAVPSTLSRQSTTTSRGIAQRASDLYSETNAICWEMDRYYKQNTNYTAVYRNIYEIKEVAKKLKAYVQQQNGRASASDSRVVSALHEMDRLFHEFEANVSGWRPSSGYSPRTQLAAMIRNCETTLHDVMNDHGIDTRYHEASHNQRSNNQRNDRTDRNPRSRPYQN